MRIVIKYNGFRRKFPINSNFPEMDGRKLAAFFEFDPTDSRELTVKVALSATGTDGALRNLAVEAAGRNFDEITASARRSWN